MHSSSTGNVLRTRRSLLQAYVNMFSEAYDCRKTKEAFKYIWCIQATDIIQLKFCLCRTMKPNKDGLVWQLLIVTSLLHFLMFETLLPRWNFIYEKKATNLSCHVMREAFRPVSSIATTGTAGEQLEQLMNSRSSWWTARTADEQQEQLMNRRNSLLTPGTANEQLQQLMNTWNTWWTAGKADEQPEQLVNS